MTRSNSGSESLPLSIREDIDQLCDRFELALISGDEPRLEAFISKWQGPHRTIVFAELLHLELDHLRRTDQAPTTEEYRDRFPEFADTVEKVFHGPATAAETALSRSTPGGRGLRIRCPHCHNPVEIVVDAELRDMVCSSCGSNFSLVDDDKSTRTATTVTKVGHFELIERLGVGGFGSVWKARDVELDRAVAVKIPRKGQLEPNEVEQFLREARAAAQLRHPNIVGVHEVGRDGETIYIVSDLVRGVPLSEWMDGYQLTSREAAKLCVKIANALHHAHEAGVVHRDLKPQNIVVDAEGEPHLMDFGLARREVGEITMTIDGQVLGTPAYMSPEQARGEAHSADRRSDVYSLGVILFQLLTGELPFRGSARMVIHQVIHDEPPSPRKLNGNMSRDLDTICLKCMEKEPDRRYQSAQQTSLDLQSYICGESIRARPVSNFTRSYRWCRKQPAAAGLLLLLLIVAVAAPIVALNQARLTALWRQAAESDRLAREKSEKLARVEGELRTSLQNQLISTHLERGVNHCRNGEWEGLLHLSRAYALVEGPHPYKDSLLPLMRGWSRSLPWPSSDIVAFSGDGRRVITAHDNEVAVWNTVNGQLIRELPQHAEVVWSVAISADGKKAITGAGKAARLWDVSSGQQLGRTLLHDKGVGRAHFVGHDQLAVTGGSRDYRLWNVSTGLPVKMNFTLSTISKTGRCGKSGRRFVNLQNQELIYELQQDSWVYDFELSQDNKRFAYADKAQAYLCDATTGKLLGQPLRQDVTITRLAFSADGGLLATAGSGWFSHSPGEAHIWSANSGSHQLGPLQHGEPIYAVAFAPDSQSVATGGRRTVRLWDVQNAALMREPMPINQEAKNLNFSSEARWLMVSQGRWLDNQLHMTRSWWDLAAATPVRIPMHCTAHVRRVAFSPDGRWLATGDMDSTVRFWDVATGLAHGDPHRQSQELVEQSLRVPPNEQGITALSFSRHSRRLVAGSSNRTARIYDVQTSSQLRAVLQHEQSVVGVAFHPDGKRVCTECLDGFARTWDAETGALCGPPLGRIERGRGPVWQRMFLSADGNYICKSGMKTVHVWNMESGRPVGVPLEHDDIVSHVAFRSDGRRLITAIQDTIQMYNTATGTLVFDPLSHGAGVSGIRFSPNARIFVTKGERVVKAWNPETGQLSGTLLHDSNVHDFAFSPDGKILITGSFDGTARVWDVATCKLLCRPIRHPDVVADVEFSPDGKIFATASGDTVRLWDARSFLTSSPSWETAFLSSQTKNDSRGESLSRPVKLERGHWANGPLLCLQQDDEARIALWHLQEVHEAAERGSVYTFNFHLNQLVTFDLSTSPATSWFAKPGASEYSLPTAYNKLGNSLADNQDYKGAIDAYKKAIEIEPNYAAAHRSLGRVLSKNQDYAAAIDAFKEAIGIEPEDAAAYFDLGVALHNKQDHDASVEPYEEAVGIEPEEKAAYYLLGNTLIRKHDHEGAIDAYKKAIEIEPDNAAVHYHLGIALLLKQNQAVAVEVYRKAIEIEPGNAAAYYLLGHTLFQKLDYDGAIHAYTKAIDIEPEDATAYCLLGDVLARKQDFAAAIEAYKEAVEIDQDFPIALNALAWLYATSPWEEHRDGKAAVVLATRACELTDFKIGGYLDTLACAYAESKDFEAAVEYQTRAIPLADKSLKGEFLKNLELFKSGRPYHQPAPSEQAAEVNAEDDR